MEGLTKRNTDYVIQINCVIDKNSRKKNRSTNEGLYGRQPDRKIKTNKEQKGSNLPCLATSIKLIRKFKTTIEKKQDGAQLTTRGIWGPTTLCVCDVDEVLLATFSMPVTSGRNMCFA